MSQQKALLLKSKQGAFEVDTTEIYKPGPGDVLVKILATALNPIDWKIQKYGVFIEKFPAVLGSDAAGVVEAVGEAVTGFKKGDRVLHEAYLTNETASFQQYTTVPSEILAKIPDNISYDEAASVPLGLVTAATGFYNNPATPATASFSTDGANLTPPWEPTGSGKYIGQGVLIFGGSSSVGQYAIQLARLSGFSPIVTTASLHNAALLKSLGATHIIDRKADIVSEAKKIFRTPPQVIYDAISEDDTQQQAWSLLSPGNILILVLGSKDFIKNGEDGRKVFNVFGNVHVQRELGKSLFAHLTDLLASGKIRPNRVEILEGGLAGIPDGLKRMEDNKVSGVKLIARPHETA